MGRKIKQKQLLKIKRDEDLSKFAPAEESADYEPPEKKILQMQSMKTFHQKMQELPEYTCVC